MPSIGAYLGTKAKAIDNGCDDGCQIDAGMCTRNMLKRKQITVQSPLAWAIWWSVNEMRCDGEVGIRST